MTNLKLAQDRPRNTRYKYKDFDVSIRFSWADEGASPTAFEITLTDQNPLNFEQTDKFENDWSDYEEALAQGKRIAEGWADQVERERLGQHPII